MSEAIHLQLRDLRRKARVSADLVAEAMAPPLTPSSLRARERGERTISPREAESYLRALDLVQKRRVEQTQRERERITRAALRPKSEPPPGEWVQAKSTTWERRDERGNLLSVRRNTRTKMYQAFVNGESVGENGSRGEAFRLAESRVPALN